MCGVSKAFASLPFRIGWLALMLGSLKQPKAAWAPMPHQNPWILLHVSSAAVVSTSASRSWMQKSVTVDGKGSVRWLASPFSEQLSSPLPALASGVHPFPPKHQETHVLGWSSGELLWEIE